MRVCAPTLRTTRAGAEDVPQLPLRLPRLAEAAFQPIHWDGGGGANRLPLWWFAPFLDMAGFGDEATAFVMALHESGLAQDRLWIGLLQVCHRPRASSPPRLRS